MRAAHVVAFVAVATLVVVLVASVGASWSLANVSGTAVAKAENKDGALAWGDHVIVDKLVAPFVGKYQSWVLGKRASAHEMIKPTFSLRLSPGGFNNLEKVLMAVSTPGDARYGKHLSKAEASALMVPMPGARDAVLALLDSHGVTGEAVQVTGNLVQATMSVEVAEAMFKTEFHHFAHSRFASEDAIRVNKPYSLPAKVAAGVQIVGGLVQLPSLRSKVEVPEPEAKPFTKAGVGFATCEHCAGHVDPFVLMTAYNVPPWTAEAKQTTMAIAQFQGVSWYDKNDHHFGAVCHLPFAVDVGTQIGYNNEKWCSNILTSNICMESLLDVQYIKGMGGNIALTVKSDTDYSLLNWANDVINMEDRAPVQSVSYGNDEIQQTGSEYMESVNIQFMALGSMGVSILFASGDQGVYGRTGFEAGPNGEEPLFHPDFPCGSPYITSVGGTDFLVKHQIGEETAWKDGGGGFSREFPRPPWQFHQVSQYLSNSAMDVDTSLFNTTGRAYPDVAALGGIQNPYCVAVEGLFGQQVMTGVGGTSASCPATAGLFARINAERAAINLPPMGFLNPWIYQNPGVFNDVKHGRNTGGGPTGFPALAGWDAATGMGTPNYGKMLTAALTHVAPTVTMV